MESNAATMEPTRTKLGPVRNGLTRKWTIDSTDLYITVNFYDGEGQDIETRCRPGEVFIKVGKHGDVVSGLMDGVALCLSLMCQYGVPLSVAIDKFRGTKFGVRDEQATSFLDAIAQAMEQIVAERRKILGD